jgi:hypothetical protein
MMDSFLKRVLRLRRVAPEEPAETRNAAGGFGAMETEHVLTMAEFWLGKFWPNLR